LRFTRKRHRSTSLAHSEADADAGLFMADLRTSAMDLEPTYCVEKLAFYGR
jgi:hypothetical protein